MVFNWPMCLEIHSNCQIRRNCKVTASVYLMFWLFTVHMKTGVWYIRNSASTSNTFCSFYYRNLKNVLKLHFTPVMAEWFLQFFTFIIGGYHYAWLFSVGTVDWRECSIIWILQYFTYTIHIPYFCQIYFLAIIFCWANTFGQTSWLG